MSAARLARRSAGLLALAIGLARCAPTDFVFVSGGVGGGGPGSSGTGASAGSGGAGGTAPPFQLDDSLRGSTMGNPIGGSLGPDGWTVTADTDRLWYALPRLVEGSVEVTVSNMSLATNMPLVDHELIAMYEAGYGIGEPINYNPQYRNNHYKVLLRVKGQAAVGQEGQQELVWKMCPAGAPGYGDGCACTEFFAEPLGGTNTWDGSPHVLRLEWGTNAETRFFKNGELVHALAWNERKYAPSEHHLSLGTSRPVDIAEAGMPIGAVFADLKIAGIEGDQDACP